MECMEHRLEMRMLRIEKFVLKQIGIIADKVEAVVTALSHCGISSESTPSGLLAAAEVTQRSRVPCIALARPHEKAVASGMYLAAGKLLFSL